jgi:endo-alpha-1,4-polygalactosaminidase (GH114 family)
VQVVKGGRIASNVSCQKLTKAKYTASEQEWQNVLKTNFKQLAEKGFKEVTLTPLVARDAIFNGEEQSREYVMKAAHDNDTQVFYLANILNKSQNTLYTVMISGNINVMTEVKTEYQRILASLGTLH